MIEILTVGKAGIFLISAFLIQACSRTDQKETDVIAEVGGKKLTSEMLKGSLPAGLSEKDSLEWLRSLTQQWIDQEVLFQNAEKSGLLNESDVQIELERIKKQYIGSLVREKLLSSSFSDLNENEITDYYRKHLDEFVNPRTLYQVCYFHVPEQRDAQNIIKEFKGIGEWQKIVTAYNLMNEEATDSVGKVVDEVGLLTILNSKNPNMISRLKKDQLMSFPVASAEDKPVTLLFLLREVFQKEQPLPVGFVRKNIENRLVVIHQKAELQQKIDSLKKESTIKIYINN